MTHGIACTRRCGSDRARALLLTQASACQTFPGAGGNDAPTHQCWAHVTAARYALRPFFTRRAAARERASLPGAWRIALSDDLTLATNRSAIRPRSLGLAGSGRRWLATLVLLIVIAIIWEGAK